jgi:hypothetical protein
MEHDKSPLQQGLELATALFEKELERDGLHPHLGKLLAWSFDSAQQTFNITNNLVQDHGERR